MSLSGNFGLMLYTLTKCSAKWSVHARFIHKCKLVNWISKDGILFFFFGGGGGGYVQLIM